MPDHEYLYSNPGVRSKFTLRVDKTIEVRPDEPVQVRCHFCPEWAGTATSVREMQSVYRAHARRHKRRRRK